MEEDGKNIQLSTKAAKLLQTRAPILLQGSGLHHVLMSCGWCGPTFPPPALRLMLLLRHTIGHTHCPVPHSNTSCQTSTCSWHTGHATM